MRRKEGEIMWKLREIEMLKKSVESKLKNMEKKSNIGQNIGNEAALIYVKAARRYVN